MNESFANEGFETSIVTGSGVQTESKPEGVASFFIKHILDQPDQTLKLWGLNLGIVNLVAIVRSIDHSSTKITYHLEDHTGAIEAHLWLEEGDALKAPSVVLNTYVRVYGSVRSQSGGKTIMIFKLEPIASINEYTTHILEVLNGRYRAEEFSKQNASEYTSNFDPSANEGQKMETENLTGLTGKNLAVFEAVREIQNDRGISFDELRKKYPNIGDVEMRNIINLLAQEGHIFSSVDADHFLCTYGM